MYYDQQRLWNFISSIFYNFKVFSAISNALRAKTLWNFPLRLSCDLPRQLREWKFTLCMFWWCFECCLSFDKKQQNINANWSAMRSHPRRSGEGLAHQQLKSGVSKSQYANFALITFFPFIHVASLTRRWFSHFYKQLSGHCSIVIFYDVE